MGRAAACTGEESTGGQQGGQLIGQQGVRVGDMGPPQLTGEGACYGAGAQICALLKSPHQIKVKCLDAGEACELDCWVLRLLGHRGADPPRQSTGQGVRCSLCSDRAASSLRSTQDGSA